MPTLRELYQKILELHKQLDSLMADFETAKKECEQAGEDDAAFSRYCQAVYDAVQKRLKGSNPKTYLNKILKEHYNGPQKLYQ